jgi:hypothetical protein
MLNRNKRIAIAKMGFMPILQDERSNREEGRTREGADAPRCSTVNAVDAGWKRKFSATEAPAND